MLPQKILVVGESCDDIFHYGSASRLCPDVPAPVFCINKTVRSQGMAGNTARNLESLGASVDAIHQPEGITKVRYVEERLNYTFLRVDDGEGDITPFSVILSTLGLTDKEIVHLYIPTSESVGLVLC